MTNDEKLAQILEESGRKDAPPGKPTHSRDWTAEAPAVEPNPIRDIGNRMREQARVLEFVGSAADIDGDKSLDALDREVKAAREFLNTPEARVLRALYLAGVLPADVYVKAVQIMRGMS